MLNIYTGRNALLPGALVNTLRACDDELDQLIIVPRQLTLETERMLLDALDLPGSFRQQVLSPERLCLRIFEAAGQPDGVRLDDRGRVMLVREAVRQSGNALTIYRGAEARRGFAQRCADQLERFRQAGVTPEQLRACAREQAGDGRMKMNDLSQILARYEEVIAGRYQDGEVEYNEAVARVPQATFLRKSRVWFYGFDMVPPTLHQLMAAVAAVSPQVSVLFCIPGEHDASDADVFSPMRRAVKRLAALAEARGVQVNYVPVNRQGGGDALQVDPPARRPALSALEEGLFAYPAREADAGHEGLRLARLNNPEEECRFAAAMARHLAYEHGWRWGDMLVLCDDLEGYRTHLEAAFDAYGIPLFLASDRPAARHRLAEFLLTAIRLVDKGFQQEDMLALAGLGLLPVTEDEAERFSNAVVTLGLRHTRFFKPLADPEQAELESIRARMMAPIEAFRSGLRAAGTLEDQLSAMYAFLTSSGALEKAEARVQALSKQGLWELAGEEAQVVNRIFGTFDQLHALMDGQKLALDVLRDLISEALSASIIKGLPQSGDAVFAQSITSACMRPVKAILALGLNDRQAGADDGLLTDAQQKALVDFTKAYLGPDAVDMARIHRFQTKNALCMATDFLLLSNAGSGTDGAAQRPSMLFQSVRALFPKLATAGGVTRDEEIDRIMGMSPKANLHTLAQRVSEGVERLSDQDRLAFVEMGIVSENDPEARQGLDLIEKALDRSSACDSLSPDTARALYGRMEYQSITSLERFANCPFSYYMRYGLSPELVEDYAFDFANEGTFFHACVESFLKESSSDIAGITQEEAERRMDMIADREIAKLMDGPLGDSALSRAEIRRMKATARACGVALREHLMDGRYTPEAMELSFGRPGDATGLVLPGGGRLHGAIDRVDVYHGEEGDFVRIVDYKRGGKKLELYQAYYGLRLQLLCYLDVARRQFNAQPAGVFYFPVKEGIVADQSQSDVVIEMLRTDEMGMDGIAANPGHEGAQSKIRRIERLARHVLERAGEHYRDIRDGSCGIAPSCTGGGHMPCTYCDYRNACMFEQKLDAGRVRTFRKMSNTAILDMFKDQEDEGEGEDSEA